jgi:hypothetical protein
MDADLSLAWLRDKMPDWARMFVDAVFVAHDEGAVDALVVGAPMELRAAIFKLASGLPKPIHRMILRRIWDQGNAPLSEAFSDNDIRRFLREAEFPIPPFTGPVTIYRGTLGIDPQTAAAGLSWTTSLAVACWFACVRQDGRALSLDPKSVVLRASIDASETIMWTDFMDEQEIIPGRPPAFEIVKQSPRWLKLARRFQRDYDERVAAATRQISELLTKGLS